MLHTRPVGLTDTSEARGILFPLDYSESVIPAVYGRGLQMGAHGEGGHRVGSRLLGRGALPL